MSRIITGKLASEDTVRQNLPLSEVSIKTVVSARENLKSILRGESDRKFLIIGPCSADFQDSILEYASFIQKMRTQFGDKLEIVMRFYTGKPRTIGGWKGLMHSYPGEVANITQGLSDCRSLALKILALGVPIADEMLYPHLIGYFEDILSYAAIGARSCENQYHREVASGLDMPVGFKNPTSGDLQIMANSVKAGQSPASYTISEHLFSSSGNLYSHAILRGGSNGSNYDATSILDAVSRLEKTGAQNPSIVIDASHGNSNKDPLSQPTVVAATISSMMGSNPIISKYIKGWMIESYLMDGRQDYTQDCPHGLSLTDGCLGIEKTEALIQTIYESL